MIIKEVYIEKFRALKGLTLPLGNKITVIAGQNGTMKTTILGMIGQPFSLRNKNALLHTARTIDGFSFQSAFQDKFKLSYPEFDKPDDHKWTLRFHNKDVYPHETMGIKSIRRSDPKRGLDEIRFWPSIGREKGMGYAQYPVLFLSLKRLTPIGEENSIDKMPLELTDEEKQFYSKYHNDILLLDDEIKAPEFLYSPNKRTLGARTANYDALSNSSGQDNIGQILLNILSFARLKNKFQGDYKGGILLIDEIDATLYPAAQIELLKSLIKFSRTYDLQVIFTTHSLSIMEFISEYDKRNNDLKLLYLVREGDIISCHENPDMNAIKADINATIADKQEVNYITVYCEDEEARQFLQAILPISDELKINIAEENMGCNNLKSLAERNISEFINNIVVLDGDAKLPDKKNFVSLPGNSRPENILFDYLKNVSANNHDIWDSFGTGGYTRQVCFKQHSSGLKDRMEAKEWFKNQSEYWGDNLKRVMIPWLNDNKELVDKFQNDFIKAYNYVATYKR